MSRFTKDAVAIWQGGTAFRVTAGSGHGVLTDGTSQAAPSPMELILSGLAGCISRYPTGRSAIAPANSLPSL